MVAVKSGIVENVLFTSINIMSIFYLSSSLVTIMVNDGTKQLLLAPFSPYIFKCHLWSMIFWQISILGLQSSLNGK